MILEKEYLTRRKRVAKALKPNSIAVLFSAQMQTRSNDTEYPFRQNSNFYYLSGFKEDNAIIVLKKESKKYKTYLFVQKKEPTMELWTGKRLGEKKAKKLFSFDAIYASEDFEIKLKELLGESKNLYVDFSVTDNRLRALREKLNNFHVHYNLQQIVGKLRLIKSKAEIFLIKKAISITKEAHHQAMKKAKSVATESELQAEIEYVFSKNGAYSDAYTSIVACGDAANTLHYISNDKKLVDKELILIDAGCEYEYYASDITRTIPVNGQFTPAQKELYCMVLDVQKKVIKMIKKGVLRTHIQAESEMLLCQGMIKLGILKGSLKKLLKDKAHKKYYPHGVGHWMGIDVHDESPYRTIKGKEIPLKVGMVMTVEPGIYCPKDDKNIPKEYRGIGIRIEDDILITKDGCENLSCEILKEIQDIQEL